MLDLILTSLYFFLPAAIANMAPVLAAKIPVLNYPISEKHLGKNKTYRGFFFGYIGAFLILLLQLYLQKSSNFPGENYQIIDYQHINLFLYAFIFGIGALSGDSIKSFFKRRLKIAPGRPFFPFDQIDFVLGVYVFMLAFERMPTSIFLTLLIIIPVLHFLTNLLAYSLKIKKVWW